MAWCIRFSGSRPARGDGGFSLVELMVAIALSLVLLAGVLAIFASSKTTYETTDRLSRLQENGRFALDSIVRDLRSAGYVGCNRNAPFNNALNESTNVMRNFAIPIEGFDSQGDGEFLPALDTDVVESADEESDVLVVRRPRGDFEPVRVVDGIAGFMKLDTDPVVVPDVTPQLIKAEDIVQISDCNSRAVFQVSANTGGVITHDEVVEPEEPEEGEEPAETPLGNKSGSLGFAFTDDAELVPVQTVVYYLRASGTPAKPGDPPAISLWRRVTGGVPEEVVEGVERMQVKFGVPEGGKIVYKAASAMGGNWSNVQTVRIALLVRSLSEYGTDTDQQSYDLLGDEVPAPGDRHLRQVFTTTVDLRNTAS